MIYLLLYLLLVKKKTTCEYIIHTYMSQWVDIYVYVHVALCLSIVYCTMWPLPLDAWADPNGCVFCFVRKMQQLCHWMVDSRLWLFHVIASNNERHLEHVLPQFLFDKLASFFSPVFGLASYVFAMRFLCQQKNNNNTKIKQQNKFIPHSDRPSDRPPDRPTIRATIRLSLSNIGFFTK